MSLVCGPELLTSVLLGLCDVGSGASSRAYLEGLVRLCAVCTARLVVLPQLWVACSYLQDRDGLPRSLKERITKVPVPVEWTRWLPVMAAACLPRPLLSLLAACACAYLGWARERDTTLAAGCGALAAATCLMWAGSAGSAAGLGLGALGLLTITLSPRAKALANCVLSAPLLCYQVLPKYLGEELGPLLAEKLRNTSGDGARARLLARVLRLAEALRPPKWENTLQWSTKQAVVDSGNSWQQVTLEGHRGQRAWESVGVTVQLSQSSPDRDAVDALLTHSAASPVAASAAGASTDASSSSGAGCDALSALVERVMGSRGGESSIHGMDSLQAIQLAEAVRREFGKPLSVADVLRCSDVAELFETVQTAQTVESPVRGERKQRGSGSKADDFVRVWLCGMGPRACTVDWMVSRGGNSMDSEQRHLDVDALQRALDRLVERHSALRARNWEETPMFTATYDAASLWQLHSLTNADWTHSRLGRLASSAIFRMWPRTRVLPPRKLESEIRLLKPRVSDVLLEDKGWNPTSTDQHAFWVGGELLNTRPAGTFFSVCVIPIFANAPGAQADDDAVTVACTLPSEEVRWYVYAVLEHGYCDGPTGLPLFADLLRLYAEESGEAAPQDPPQLPDALQVLQGRLLQSLKPLPEAEHPNDDIFHDGLLSWGYRAGFQRLLKFDVDLMRLLRVAAQDSLGFSVDVAWLTAIAAAFLRMFPDLRRLDLYLIVTCRDRPGEEMMVGYFSSRKVLPLELGNPRELAILGLANMVSTARRQRTWHRPRLVEKYTGIEVNMVSQAADGLPFGFREVRYGRNAPSSWHRGGSSAMTVRLDQFSRDDWDFRMQSHTAAWGESWSNYYAQALGSVLVDMAVRPAGPVVPS